MSDEEIVTLKDGKRYKVHVHKSAGFAGIYETIHLIPIPQDFYCEADILRYLLESPRRRVCLGGDTEICWWRINSELECYIDTLSDYWRTACKTFSKVLEENPKYSMASFTKAPDADD